MPSGGPSSVIASADALDRQGKHDEALAILRAAAQKDAATGALLGRRLIVGHDSSFAPQEGLTHLAAAADKGDADALMHLATLSGAGAWVPQSWPKALELLQQAAEAGSAEARTQMSLLVTDRAGNEAHPDDVKDGPNRWRQLGERIDLEAFTKPPAFRPVCERPRIWTADKCATPRLCAWLVDHARGRAKPALMFDGQKKRLQANRTNSDFVFDLLEGGLVLLLLRFRMSALTQVPGSHMEPPQIFHYATGQEIGLHFDFLYDGEHGYGAAGGYHGDRLVTFLMWLNDDYEGGELDFPRGPYRCRGKTGDGVFFASQFEGKPDKMSAHAALPVTKGEKYILSQWIHDRPFTA